MRKALFVAVVAIGSSLSLYSTGNSAPAEMQNTPSECCDKSECCPMDDSEDCREFTCE